MQKIEITYKRHSSFEIVNRESILTLHWESDNFK